MLPNYLALARSWALDARTVFVPVFAIHIQSNHTTVLDDFSHGLSLHHLVDPAFLPLLLSFTRSPVTFPRSQVMVVFK